MRIHAPTTVSKQWEPKSEWKEIYSKRNKLGILTPMSSSLWKSNVWQVQTITTKWLFRKVRKQLSCAVTLFSAIRTTWWSTFLKDRTQDMIMRYATLVNKMFTHRFTTVSSVKMITVPSVHNREFNKKIPWHVQSANVQALHKTSCLNVKIWHCHALTLLAESVWSKNNCFQSLLWPRIKK